MSGPQPESQNDSIASQSPRPAPTPGSKERPEAKGYPAGWYLFCRQVELRRGPVGKELLGKQLVAFLTEDGNPGVIGARCVHMGASLAGGAVVGDSLQCPLHHWRFATNGACSHIPATEGIPAFARQLSYPAELRHGNLYFFNGPEVLYPLPFFNGIDPSELVAAPPFIEIIDCPWYMVGANAVDVQHFAIAHDRRMLAPPEVRHPSPFSHYTVCRFEILGRSLFDAITRRFGGPEARLEVTDWSSTMVFAHSKLAHAETLGMLSMVPLSPKQTMVQVTVMARRGSSAMVRLLDPLRSRIRRVLIRRFLRSDVGRLAQSTYSPNTLIEIDQKFAEYFEWLDTVPR